MKIHSSKHPVVRPRRSWMVSGIAMFLTGMTLYLSLASLSFGILLMILGLAAMIGAYLYREPHP